MSVRRHEPLDIKNSVAHFSFEPQGRFKQGKPTAERLAGENPPRGSRRAPGQVNAYTFAQRKQRP